MVRSCGCAVVGRWCKRGGSVEMWRVGVMKITEAKEEQLLFRHGDDGVGVPGLLVFTFTFEVVKAGIDDPDGDPQESQNALYTKPDSRTLRRNCTELDILANVAKSVRLFKTT